MGNTTSNYPDGITVRQRGVGSKAIDVWQHGQVILHQDVCAFPDHSVFWQDAAGNNYEFLTGECGKFLFRNGYKMMPYGPTNQLRRSAVMNRYMIYAGCGFALLCAFAVACIIIVVANHGHVLFIFPGVATLCGLFMFVMGICGLIKHAGDPADVTQPLLSTPQQAEAAGRGVPAAGAPGYPVAAPQGYQQPATAYQQPTPTAPPGYVQPTATGYNQPVPNTSPQYQPYQVAQPPSQYPVAGQPVVGQVAPPKEV